MDWSKQCYQCYKFTIIEEYEDRYIKPYNVQRIAWMVKLPYVVVSDYLGIDDGSKWKD
jgi:hypothetical protein